MSAKADQLAELRQAFRRRWASALETGDRGKYDQHDFEIDLDRLIYAAFAVALEPFVRELEIRRNPAVLGDDRH